MDRVLGTGSSSKPTTWPGTSKATCTQATRALAASRKWLRQKSKLLLQLLQSVPRVTQRGIERDGRPVRADRQRHVVVHLVCGCESVSGSCRRWVQFAIGFKGPDGVA